MQRLCAGAPNHGEPRADFSAAAPVRPRPKKKYACKGMAVTSEYFRANLGLLDSDAAGMLDPWCQRTYEQHFIGRGPSGEYVLTASCRQPKSRKSILMAIRTAFSNSGHPLSSLRGDGVELWTDAQFEKVPAPELNDNYEELLELWEKMKAKYARV